MGYNTESMGQYNHSNTGDISSDRQTLRMNDFLK